LRPEARSKKGKSACGVYLPDLEQPLPPDVPPDVVMLRLSRKLKRSFGVQRPPRGTGVTGG
jgi:hypothetical protein